MDDLLMVSDPKDLAVVEEAPTFRIAWRNKMTGTTGKGMCLPQHTAEAWLNRANMESGEVISHWLEPCGDTPQAVREPSLFSKVK